MAGRRGLTGVPGKQVDENERLLRTFFTDIPPLVNNDTLLITRIMVMRKGKKKKLDIKLT